MSVKSETATKSGPRWWVRILSVLVVLGLLAGAAEIALRLILPGIVAGAVRTQLKLTDDHDVEVGLGGSQLLAALGGGVSDITVQVPEAPLIEGVSADVSVHADRVPFSVTTGEITNGTANLTVPKERLSEFAEILTQGLAQTVEVRDGGLMVGRSMELLGQEVPLSATLGLTIVDGAVEVEPRGVAAAGFDLSADQISGATGGLLAPMLESHTFCIKDRLPAGITLTDIVFSSTGSVSVKADLDPRIASDKAQQQPGTCG